MKNETIIEDYVIPVPADAPDKGTPGTAGGYTESDLLARNARQQEEVNKAAIATWTHKN